LIVIPEADRPNGREKVTVGQRTTNSDENIDVALKMHETRQKYEKRKKNLEENLLNLLPDSVFFRSD